MSKSVQQASAAPAVRAERTLRAVDGLFLRLDRLVERVLPAHLNPFAQTGAIATTSFLIALVSGIALLIWYRPSVHQAYLSVELMAQHPWTAGWLRSVHRYSSDACLFFVLLHACKLFFGRRFTGARWLAWITGMFLLFLLWLVGWLGYWLVWDVRGQQVAIGTAKLLDLVPIFADPLSRTYLADSHVSSLFFFVVFFAHMLIPLAMALPLWLHIARVARPRFVTGRTMSLWVVGATLVLGRLLPVESAAVADMAVQPAHFTIDAWYLLPVLLTDRLSGGLLWAVFLVVSIVVLSAPWWMRRTKIRAAVVNPGLCNGCTQCAQDCPYDAIVIVHRLDNSNKYPLVAQVDPERCVGCGICVGSCNPGGIALDWLPTQQIRKGIDAWIDDVLAGGEEPLLAFLCAESAAAFFTIDEKSGRCLELPAYRVMAVPCSGWVNALTIERALRRGAAGILVVGCSSSDPGYREGVKWTGERLEGVREPELRRDKIDAERVHFVQFDRTRPTELLRTAELLKKSAKAALVRNRTPSAARQGAAGVLVAACLGLVLFVASDARYPAPPTWQPQLVISLKHHGAISDNCRTLTDEELARRPRHMQKAVECSRERAAVRLRVLVDAEPVLLREYRPRGITRDGPAVAVETVHLAPGTHEVVVEIADGHDPDHFAYRASRHVTAEPGKRTVVIFEHDHQFEWH
ncbi:MAG: hydrogenase iron-sulfur subunit [Bradymonadaceae bacterium]|nr:hydrogenase iron-sulfur subunit [Lujinxingiaceae bacterium]